MVKKMFTEIRLCNPMTYDFKEHVKIVEIYMVKFNVSIFKIMVLFVNAKYVHKHNVILNKTNQTFHYFDKMFFDIYLNPTSYHNQNVNISFHYIFFYKTSKLSKHN